jgi:hypothetical protein
MTPLSSILCEHVNALFSCCIWTNIRALMPDQILAVSEVTPRPLLYLGHVHVQGEALNYL